jgi:hypothetical protein
MATQTQTKTDNRDSKTDTSENRSNFKYDSPSFDKLSSEDAYNQALKFNEFNNRVQQNNLSAGLNLGKNAAIETEQAKQTLNQQNAMFNKSLQDSGSSRSAGGSSSAFGIGAAAPSGYTIDYKGTPSLYNASEVANWRNRQAGVLNDQLYLAKGLSNIQNDADSQKTARDNLYSSIARQQSAAIDSQKSNQDFIKQKQLQDAQLNTQRDIAGIQAQGNIFSGLFNSIGIGGNNRKYWN